MAEPDPRRAVPRTDTLLADARLAPYIARLGRERVKSAVRAAQSAVRCGELDPRAAVEMARASLESASTSMRSVINATGVVLHTNLGRAPLSRAAVEALAAAAGYVDVEYDLATGARARRGRGTLAALRSAVGGEAGDVLVVNNGAAALVLVVTALGRMISGQPEIIMSRGELVEIGDGFRLPDLISSTGARIVEVGTTNRTNLADYEQALSARTACVIKIHPSNFRVEGFTGEATVAQLSGLDRPLVVDIGSGLLAPEPMLPAEPDVSSTLAGGADLVICSGDKLLGGPQSGLVFGRAELIEQLRRDPLARALRVDKLALAALAATVAGGATPVHDYLHADPAVLHRRTRELADALPALLGAEVVPVVGAVGGGGAPGVALPGWALALPANFADRLRAASPPVVGRIEGGRCLLDLRCVPAEQDPVVRKVILATFETDG